MFSGKNQETMDLFITESVLVLLRDKLKVAINLEAKLSNCKEYQILLTGNWKVKVGERTVIFVREFSRSYDSNPKTRKGPTNVTAELLFHV